MTLKTLKDLQQPSDMLRLSFPPQEVFGVDVEKLKAEAVKWVKFYTQDLEDENMQWIRMWIVKFFNLTEEDYNGN